MKLGHGKGERKMRMKKCCFVALFALAVLCLAAPGTAATWYVTQDGAGNEDGSSWANAGKNLKDVMEATDAGDEIWVVAGTYSPGSNKTDTFLLKKGVKVYGGFAGTETDLDQRNWVDNKTTLHGGGVNYHVVTGEPGADNGARLDGFTVTGGSANGSDPDKAAERSGGGMYNNNSSPTVANCTFSGNTAGDGGGMFNGNSSPMVENCDFSGNTVKYEGGGMENNNSSPMVVNCTFSGNTAAYGGGMFNNNSSPTVESCDFSGNTAEYEGGGMRNHKKSRPTVANCTFSVNTAAYGGGMYNANSSLTVANCVFSGNTTDSGGGMFNDNSSPTVESCDFSGNTANTGGGMFNGNSSSPIVVNCTFSGNSARFYDGGGMENNNSSPILVNCTFSGNTATKSGGGMYNYDSSPTVVNTILWGNVAPDDGGLDIYQSGGTLTLDHCVVGVYDTEDDPTVTLTVLITDDPKLTSVKLQPTTVSVDVHIYGLEPGSSALDAGLPVGETIRDGVKVPDVDQLGTPRPQGAGVDIGAFERKR